MKLTSPGSCVAAKEVKRKHSTIITSYLDEDFLDMTRYHSLNKLIIFSFAQEFKISDLVKALNSLPLLKSLDTFADFIDDMQDIKEAPKVRLNLKKLHCNLGIFHIFDCETLNELHIKSSEVLVSNRRNLINFMNRQKELKKLTINSFDLFEDYDCFVCPFQLKRFKICGSIEHTESLIEFLYFHKNSLEVFKLSLENTTTTAIEQIQKFVIGNLPNLKELTLDMPIEINQLHHDTYVSRKLQKLSLNAHDRSFDENKRIVDLFPNVKNLCFYADSFDAYHVFLNYLSITNLKLECLKTNLYFNMSNPIPYFPNLKVLTASNFNTDELDAFVNQHLDTLEEINILYSYGFKQSTVTAISKCKNLKKITFLTIGQAEQDKLINLLSGLLSISKPFEILFYPLMHPFLTTRFKLPEDRIFLGLKSNQNFKDQIMQSCTKIYNFLFSN